MILVASQRAGATQLADHLTNANDNETVEIGEIRGFYMDDSVHAAFKEIEALSKGTQCTQFMFSLSLNPPSQEVVGTEQFNEAVNRIEDELGLSGQPRVIVFHEKDGRRHAHAVWSRIDTETMRSINLPFFKRRLNEISRDLFLEHGWDLPKGYLDSEKRDPLNYSLSEYQQAKRLDENPRALKYILQSCWRKSESRAAFDRALRAHGFYLARGNRRGFVAVNMTNEVLSLSRWLGVKDKELTAKLGCKEGLPSFDDISRKIDQSFDHQVQKELSESNDRKRETLIPLLQERQLLIDTQKAQRTSLKQQLASRQLSEVRDRQSRFRHGLRGLWDRMTGKHKALQRKIEIERAQSEERDKTAWDKLVQEQLSARQHVVSKIRIATEEFRKEKRSIFRLAELHRRKDTVKSMPERKRRRAPTLGR